MHLISDFSECCPAYVQTGLPPKNHLMHHGPYQGRATLEVYACKMFCGGTPKHKQGCVSPLQSKNGITVVMARDCDVTRFFLNPAHTCWMRKPAASRCLCCGYKTLSMPEALELCQVCWWQDDGQDDRDADVVRRTVNGNLSLSEGRRNYKFYQAADPRFVAHVRTPRQEEL